VRIDSGDLAAMARKVRVILDNGGLKDVIILVSGGINEDVLQTITAAKAPIDGYGIGVNLDASIDAPSLDCAYKLQEYAGTPRRKLSEGKVTWPGRKQVWRSYDTDGRMRGDVLTLENDIQTGDALIVPVMRSGKRVASAPTLAQIREHTTRELARLPEPLRKLETGTDYLVTISEKLKAVAEQIGAKARG
jgi:nicotinate phosphoribosyltransferase